jgi:hypothetical protein
VTDARLRRAAQGEGFVLVTDNVSDFRPMFAREEVHPGLVVMPGEYGRDGQQRLAGRVIDFIVATAREAGETPVNLIVNRLVEIDDDATASAHELPPSRTRIVRSVSSQEPVAPGGRPEARLSVIICACSASPHVGP